MILLSKVKPIIINKNKTGALGKRWNIVTLRNVF